MEIQQPTADRTGRTPEAFRQNIVNNLYYSRGANVQSASAYDIYMALSRTVRNHLVERFRSTVDMRYAVNPRMVYYLSAEYLLGRQLQQNLLYSDTDDLAAGSRRGLAHKSKKPGATSHGSSDDKRMRSTSVSPSSAATSSRSPAGRPRSRP